jgi:hypothetical protein
MVDMITHARMINEHKRRLRRAVAYKKPSLWVRLWLAIIGGKNREQ